MGGARQFYLLDSLFPTGRIASLLHQNHGMAEPPPPVLQFGRYDTHAKSAWAQTGLHASRIQLGEVIDHTRRPPLRFQVEDDHMRLYNSMADVRQALASVLAFVLVFHFTCLLAIKYLPHVWTYRR